MSKPLSEAVIGDLRTFLRLHLATESDEADGFQGGRFAFQQGRTFNESRKATEPVAWLGDPERIVSIVVDRVRDLNERDEGSIWVLAYHEGKSTAIGRKHIKSGDGSVPPAEVPTKGGEVAALVAGNLEALREALSDNRDLRARLQQFNDWAVVMTREFTIENIYRVAMEQGAQAASTQAALEAAMPTLEKLVPILAAKMAGGPAAPAAANQAAPGTPRERVAAAMGRIDAAVAEAFQAITEEPELGNDRALFAPLRDLIMRAAAGLGLNVTEATA